jgi:hypothetical protein
VALPSSSHPVAAPYIIALHVVTLHGYSSSSCCRTRTRLGLAVSQVPPRPSLPSYHRARPRCPPCESVPSHHASPPSAHARTARVLGPLPLRRLGFTSPAASISSNTLAASSIRPPRSRIRTRTPVRRRPARPPLLAHGPCTHRPCAAHAASSGRQVLRLHTRLLSTALPACSIRRLLRPLQHLPRAPIPCAHASAPAAQRLHTPPASARPLAAAA